MTIVGEYLADATRPPTHDTDAEHTMNRTIRRYITWFDPHTERLVGEADLKGLSLRNLQDLFGEPADQPMYDCYPITPDKLPALQPHVPHTIRLNRYDYFVEAEAAPVPEPSEAD